MAGSWEGLGSGASKWGARTVRRLNIVSHLFRASEVLRLTLASLEKLSADLETGLAWRGVCVGGVSEPPNLFLYTACSVSHSIASSADDLEIASSNSKGPSGSQTREMRKDWVCAGFLVSDHWTQEFGLGDSVLRGMSNFLSDLSRCGAWGWGKGHLFTY